MSKSTKKSKSRKSERVDVDAENPVTTPRKSRQNKQTISEDIIRKIVQSVLGSSLREELKKLLPPYMIQSLPLDTKKPDTTQNKSISEAVQPDPLIIREPAPVVQESDAKDLKLWKVEIGDDRDDLLRNLTLQDQPELLATREVGDYWSEKPPKRHIHVLVEPPVTTTASNEVLELREKLASLQALLNKSVHGTCV
ncbi:hypothetical protein C1646_676983 [Rhizophagus diaphanus]|nr:hypothetical protein C1646_676983 [Rhizophagus diaphanus] [Rhizophagus sp. MUCL 43196]